ncbi:MAG: LuxR C-terminal-related transcriptional regulator, partial [Novosphingobium sp.]
AQDMPIFWVSRGLTLLQKGWPDQARLAWQRFEDTGQSGTFTPMTRGFIAYGIGLSHLWEGRCALAEQGLRPALAQAEARMGRRNLVSSMLAALLARSRWENGSDDEPAALLALRLDVLERQGLPDALMSAYLTIARISESQGRHDKALSLLEELRAIGINRSMPRLHFSAQCEMVRQHARAGRAETAGVLARQIEIALVRGHAHYPAVFLPRLELKVMLSKVHAALAHTGEDHLRDLLPEIAQACEVARSLSLGLEFVELQLLSGLVLARLGDPTAAAVRAEALSLAQVNGQLRLATLHGGAEAGTSMAAPTPTPAAEAGSGSASGAILTIKEREILGLLDRSLSNKEIAMALDLSEQTVKWHLKNLFQKLNGVDRKHAVARARMLGLLGP